MNTLLQTDKKPKPQKNKVKFTNANLGNLDRNIRNASRLHKAKNKQRRLRTIYHNQLKGKKAVICGSGHSLTDPEVLTEIRKLKAQGHLIVACKHAIRYLTEQSIKVDYGVTMDPSAHIARPDIKIYKAQGMTHIVASSSDPLLFRYLMAYEPYETWLNSLKQDEAKQVLTHDYDKWVAGNLHFSEIENHPEDLRSKILLFHSACGVEDEVNLYKKLFKNGDVVGGGYNVVNRAFSAMLYMGIDSFTFAGVDCGWREDSTFYTFGNNPIKGVDLTDSGAIDGKEWKTRPDMMASAVSLVQKSREQDVQMSFIGDSMPRSLLQKDDAFLEKMLEMIA